MKNECFWFHDWGKWEQFTKMFNHYRYGLLQATDAFGKPVVSYERWQRRKCNNCGKEQQERID